MAQPRPMDGYPTSWGSSRAAVLPHAGPASYTQITRGTAPANATGGDSVSAVSAGLKLISYVVGGITDTGNFRVDGIATSRSGQTPFAVPKTTYTLKWTALATATIGGQSQTINTEAAASSDLSGEYVRLLVIGPK